MTTIVVRDGIMAADSCVTVSSEAGGDRKFRCEKIYKKVLPNGETVLIGTAGESAPGLVFVDWYGSGKPNPTELLDGEADIDIIVLTTRGVFGYDKWCRGEKLMGRFHAIGSGTKAALGALHMGATARQAVRIACKIDPYSAPPIVTMSLK